MKKYSKFLGILLAVVISVAIFFFRDKLIVLKEYGYLGLFILSVLGSATIILPAPVILLAFGAGGVLNPIAVALVVSSGSAIGEITGYVAGISGKKLVEENKWMVKVEGWMKRYGLWTIFVMAAIPNFLFDLGGIIAGSSQIPIRKFILVTWAGRLIRYLILAYLGSRLI